MSEVHPVQIYTDGACPLNPGEGSWAFVVVENGQVIEELSSPSFGKTTNNIMELEAIMQAISYAVCEGITQVTIFSDSQYAINSVSVWCHKWKSNGWTKKKGKPIKNLELIKEIYNLIPQVPELNFKWVKGHNGNIYNERADQLCNLELNSSPQSVRNFIR